MRNRSNQQYSAIGTKVTDTIKVVNGLPGSIPGRPVTLLSITVTNANASVRYLQLFDSTGATTTVISQHDIPASGELELGENVLTLDGYQFFNGLTYGISTTSGTYTAATATDHDVFAIYA